MTIGILSTVTCAAPLIEYLADPEPPNMELATQAEPLPELPERKGNDWEGKELDGQLAALYVRKLLDVVILVPPLVEVMMPDTMLPALEMEKH